MRGIDYAFVWENIDTPVITVDKLQITVPSYLYIGCAILHVPCIFFIT